VKRILILFALGGTLASLSAPAWAGTLDEAVIALHIGAKSKKATEICTKADPVTLKIACSNFVITADPMANYDVYLVVARGGDPGPGIAGASCGVAFDENIGMFGWELCSDLHFPNGPDGGQDWPASGGGNRITWAPGTNCQRTSIGSDGVHAVAGAFYVYPYDAGSLWITENLNLRSGPEFRVADCSASETSLSLSRAGAVQFGASDRPGCNPCVSDCSTPVEETTWGQLKNKYE
jgi:hypothetical protein